MVVDTRTKKPEVISMKTATSTTTIEQLRAIFVVLPHIIVSDNGSVFTSQEFASRLIPHSTKDQSPSETLMQRKIRSRLDLPRPDLEHKVHLKQPGEKHNHDKRAKKRSFQAGDLAYARNYAVVRLGCQDRSWLSKVHCLPLSKCKMGVCGVDILIRLFCVIN